MSATSLCKLFIWKTTKWLVFQNVKPISNINTVPAHIVPAATIKSFEFFSYLLTYIFISTFIFYLYHQKKFGINESFYNTITSLKPDIFSFKNLEFIKNMGTFVGLTGMGVTLAGILLYLISKNEQPIKENYDV